MKFSDDMLSQDDFLGGALRIWQPLKGYRAATDPVLLAAAVGAKPGQKVLDLGCGAGTALACLCHRVEGVEGFGLELQPAYAQLAERNARDNTLPMRIFQGDLLDMPRALREISFDHVFTNPPFYDPSTATAPQDAGRDVAHREGGARLEDWVNAALKRLKPRGYFTIIHRAERLADILGALQGKAGDVRILPLGARPGRAAGRVIVQARKGAAGPLKLLAPMVLHTGNAHSRDEDNFSEIARNILRNAQPIVM